MADRLAATLALEAPATSIAGVSAARGAALAKLGIRRVRDVVTHYPRRYLDMSRVETIASARIGESATILATVHEAVLKRPRPKFELVEVTLVDGTGTLIATFFRQPWLVKTLRSGMRVSVAGTMEFNYGYKRMTMPFLDKIEEGDQARGRIVPVHAATEKVPAGQMRRIAAEALEAAGECYDPLPLALRTRYRLFSRDRALSCIHFPQTPEELSQARRRLVYEEVLLLELHLMREARAAQGDAPAHVHTVDGPRMAALREALPFALTDDQRAAVRDILERMAAPTRMMHMLLGDVGTGKTVVSAFALAAAADSGTQALMMGPTEVLADQYAAALGPLLSAAGIRWVKFTGSTPAAQRAEALAALASGEASVAFGTHALLESDVACRSCSLVVIDEEQRFGVDQREALMAKGEAPDVLSMTATPIPRTLALALYGFMSLSYVRTAPGNRPPRTTKVYGFRERGRAYDVALAACKRGEQVYVVCPLVGEKKGKAAKGPAKGAGKGRARFGGSGTSADALPDEDELPVYIESDADMEGEDADPAAAQAQAAFLQAKTFSQFKVGLLHGRMKAADKRTVMDDFRAGKVDVLVSTTVIEVGVDVPNATVMIVEDADRFGLSQLHQLRGRVGRGSKPGFMCLVASTGSSQAMERLSAMERTDDGFELAEYDLSLRREGDILGNRQHGASSLKLVNVIRDGAAIEAAHADAAELLARPGFEESAAGKALLHEADAVFAHEDDTKGHA